MQPQRMGQKKMVKVSVEVSSGTARFRVGVQAQSISKALSMVGGRYPRSEVRVVFPTGPEGFFVRVPSVLAGMVVSERAQREAA